MSQGTSNPSISRNKRITRYNTLKRDIIDLVTNTSELTVETASQANQIWREVHQIPVQGVDTDELLLALDVNERVANFFQETLPHLHIAETLSLDTLVSKLKENVDRDGWNESMQPFNFLRSSVSFQALNQRRAPVVVNLTNKEKKQRQKKEKDVLAPATQPTQIASGGLEEKKGDHADLIDRTLNRIYKETRSPIEFWSFVIDPLSFENTIENMFTVNILVNNNRIKLFFDSDREKFLEPVSSRNQQEKIDPKEKTQMFLPFSVDQYNEQLERLQISSPAIKRPSVSTEQNSDSD